MYMRNGPGTMARTSSPTRQLSFVRRAQKGLRRTFDKSLPALLPGIHQVSGKTAFDRYPEIFTAAAAALPDARHILSFGCSTGEECATLAMYFPKANILGADVNPLRLWKAYRRYHSDQVGFVYARDGALKRRAPFDLIFCLTVLRNTRLDSEPSIRASYPFERFDERVRLLNLLLRPGGLLVFHGNMYRFCDSSVASEYQVIPLNHTPIGPNITFARDGTNDDAQYLDSLFWKKPVPPQLPAISGGPTEARSDILSAPAMPSSTHSVRAPTINTPAR
jgi:hypothetical protein